MMDAAPRNHHFSTENLALRMLIMNFVALHTTSMVRLYHPAAAAAADASQNKSLVIRACTV